MTFEGNILKVPNKDEYRGMNFYSKDVIQKGYTDAIGKYIDVCGEKRLVKSVEINDDWITIILN